MKTLAKYHVCSHCVNAGTKKKKKKKKHLKIYLSGPVSYSKVKQSHVKPLKKKH